MTLSFAETPAGQAQQLKDSGQSLFFGSDERGSPVWGGVRDSASVVGPQGCGKTSAVFVPSVMCHPGPVIATSVRQYQRDPGLREATLSARQSVADHFGGSVVELAIDDSFGYVAPTTWWDFTDGCDTWNRAIDRARSLARTGIKPTLENFTDWRNWVADLLAPLLFAARTCWEPRLDDRDLANMIIQGPHVGETGDHDRPNVADALATLTSVHGSDHPSTRLLHHVCRGGVADETLQTTFMLVRSNITSVFDYDPIDFGSILSLSDFLMGYGTLYITATPDRAKDANTLIGSMLEAVAATWFGLSPADRPPSLLLALDEVTSVAPISSLPQAVGMYGGSGIQLLLGLQHSSFTRGPWGDEGLGVVTGTNHLMLFPGLTDDALTDPMTEAAERQIRTDREIEAVDVDRANGRYADAARLIRERTEYEDALDGKKELFRKVPRTKALMNIRKERISAGVKNRYGHGLDDLERELIEMTRVRLRPARRGALEKSDIFSPPDQQVFLKSGNSLRFVTVAPYYKSAPWVEWVALDQ